MTTKYMTAKEVRMLLLNKAQALKSREALAAQLRVSPQYLGDVILGRREPGKKILAAIGFERVTLYAQIGGSR